MSRFPRILDYAAVMLIVGIVIFLITADIPIDVSYELDADGHPERITVGIGQEEVEINTFVHYIFRFRKTDVRWTLHHPSPPAANTVWTLERKPAGGSHLICPDSIRFSEQGTADCAAQDNGILNEVNWRYAVIATSTDGSYDPRKLDPAIVFRTGKGTIFGLLLAVLAGLYFGYRLSFKKKRAA